MTRKLGLMLLLCLPLMAHAELVIVTGNQSPVSTLNDNEVRQLFSGQLRSVAGQRLQPLDLPANSPHRNDFYRKLMGRSPDQMRAYWTRLIFTGQGQPPREVSSIQELILLVNSSPEYIGYLPAEDLNANLRVLHRLP